MYGKKVIFCEKCLMPSSRPRIVFKGKICNGCINTENKKKIDWELREKEFLDIIEKYRNKHSAYDCIVPWSGGKDSSSIALKLKFKYKLNPLLVTFSPMIPTEIGNHNREQLIKLGFDNIFFRPNQKVAQHLSKRFLIERGNPKVAWDAGINVAPILIGLKMNIPLIFYAEHGESEYGGYVISEKHTRERDIAEFLENQVGDDPRNWVDGEVDTKDLNPYIYPDEDEVKQKQITAFYFSYFFKWDVFDNFKYVSKKIDFKTAPNGRTDGTFTNYDSLDDKMDNLYYHMQFIKFGFGRSLRDSSRLIQLGYLKKEQAKEYIKKYDSEFPKTYLNDVLNYYGINSDELKQIINKHRNSEIWKFEKEKWQIINKIK